jgi:hypothetical protein
MNSALIVAGSMIICFADREAGSITFQSGLRISFRYPFLGVALLVIGMTIP